jgi:hydrogenase maturation protease
VVTKEQVRQSLNAVLVPGIMRSVVGLNLVRGISISDHKVIITLASSVLNVGALDWIKTRIEEVIAGLIGVEVLEIEFIDAKPAELNEVRHIIAVMSGKGGVGKSLVASLLAVALRRQGHEVGILDGDITGPSIPRMFGITARPTGGDSGILPVLSRAGIAVMSINLLLPDENDAVIWRGPLIGKAITEFWEDVLWGRLDYLIIDLPPGTADAALAVMQTLPVSGVLIVITPQDLTAMIVKKAVNMAQKMDIPIIGVVENMSYLYVSEIDKRIEIFGKSRGETMARAVQAPFLGQLPLDPQLSKLCDEGNIERYDNEIVSGLGQSVSQAIPA